MVAAKNRSKGLFCHKLR